MYLYLMKNTEKIWTPTHQRLLAFVSCERREKILRYRFEEDRILSLYSALLTRLGAVRHFHCSNDTLVFGEDENHKPCLLSAKGNANTTFHFNFSHTRNAVLLGTNTNAPIGVDIEKISTPPLSVMNKVFHPDEIAYISEVSSSAQAVRFYEMWTRKEAYTKYLGCGLITSLTSINTLADPVSGLIHTWADSGFICSVCTVF